MTDTSLPFDSSDATARAFGDTPWEALARYLAGESKDDEACAIEQWLAAHENDARLVAVLDAATRLRADAPGDVAEMLWDPATPIDVEGALARVKSRSGLSIIRTRDRARTATRRSLTSFRLFGPLGGALAAAAVLVVVALRVISHEAPAQDAVRTLTTGAGALDSALLADGSRIVVAPESKVTIDARANGRTRDVLLVGEARFVVRHDPAHPFVVHAGDALIRDVGTSFTVRTDSDAVTVSVQDGAVSLGAADHPDDATEVHAGERVVLHANGQLDRELADAETDTAWTHGHLVFRDAPMPIVRSELRRWYGIDLAVADSTLAARRLTASFDGQSATMVVRTIALALGADVQQQGARVTLTTPRR